MKKFKKIAFATIIVLVVLSTTVISSFADNRPSYNFNDFSFAPEEIMIRAWHSEDDGLSLFSLDGCIGTDVMDYLSQNPGIDSVSWDDNMTSRSYLYDSNKTVNGWHNAYVQQASTPYVQDVYSVEHFTDDTYYYNEFRLSYQPFLISTYTESQYIPLYSISLNPHLSSTIPSNTLTQWYSEYMTSPTVTVNYYADDGNIKKVYPNLHQYPLYDEYGTMIYLLPLDSIINTDIYSDSRHLAYIDSMYINHEYSSTAKTSYATTTNIYSYNIQSQRIILDDRCPLLPPYANETRIINTSELKELINSDLVDTTDFNFWSFLTTSIGGFFDFELFPGLSFGGIGLACISIGLLFAVLKYFAGG